MKKKILQEVLFILKKKSKSNLAKFELIKQGRNSKVYQLRIDKKTYVVKIYVSNQSQRLKREINMYKFLKYNKIKNTAELLGFNKTHNFATYSLIKGKKVNKISDNNVVKAANFIVKLNNKNLKSIPRYLAIDGIRKLNDHYDDSNKRIINFLKIKPKSKIEDQFLKFVKNSLQSQYKKLLNELETEHFLNLKKIKIYKKNFILSPSDFGFHNILQKNKILFFFDFEYSGLDDPTKLICDFISQPDQLITKKQENIFKSIILKKIKNRKDIEYLIKVFLPFYKLKWCCIILNDFRPEKKKIRLHASRLDNQTLKSQLIKAKRYYKKNFKEK